MTKKIKLTRRRVLASLGATGLAAAGAGVGTSAYLNDTESFEGNQMTAGELDLKIDWQQRYWGPEATDASVYGEAGRPWVNAHPDHDGDGIQSLDSDQYDSVADDGVVTYETQGGNIQRYLTCETLDHEYDFGDRNALIDLADVKPGDTGEVTFSYHLCDNPGYIWLCGDLVEASENGLTEPEEDAANEDKDVVELLDAINVQVWYDIDCDNQFDDADREILAGSPTTLRSFLGEFEQMQDNCKMLNAGIYPGISGTHSCQRLDTIEFTSNGLQVGGSGTGQVVKVDPGTPADDSDNLQVWVQLKDPSNPAFNAAIIKFDDMYTSGGFRANSVSDLNDIIQFDWTRVDDVVGDDGQTYESEDTGMCRLRLGYGSGSLTSDLIASGCSTGEDDVVVPNGGDVITTAEFSYCDPSGGDPVCFPANRTFCIGFEWWISPAVENEIQGDSVSFDLGFYTEQCRHNDSPGPINQSGQGGN